ncbi:MAG: T9SS type A sorting domain-containing protein, partial [Flavobacteriales bacterium]
EWYGNVYTGSGVYSNQSTNEFGCTYTEYLNLTINYSTSSYEYASACGSYEWYGNVYYSSGQYSYQTTNEYGCTHTIYLDLYISNDEYYYESASGCNSYYWYGNEYYSSGTYTYSYTNEYGCNIVYTLDLYLGYDTYQDIYAEACYSYEWNGETLYYSGDYSYTLPNQYGCGDIVTLHLTIYNGTTNYTDIATCYGYDWYGSFYTESGTYEYSYTDGSGCTNTEVLNLTVYPTPVVEAGTYTAICGATSTIELFGTPTGGTWSGVGVSGNIFSANAGTQTLTYSYTNEYGCTAYDETTVDVSFMPAIPGPISGPTAACEFMTNSTTAFYSVPNVPGVSYVWLMPLNATLVSGAGTNVAEVAYNEFFTGGNIRVKAMTVCGLSPNAALFVSVTGLTTPGLITGTNKACNGDIVTFSISAVNNATYYNWTAPFGSTIISGQGSTSVDVQFNAGFTSSGVISVTASNDCGTSNPRTKTITPNAPLKPSVITGQVFGNCNSTSSYSVVQVGSNTYNWTAPAGAMIIAGQGTNTVTLYFTSGFVPGLLSVVAQNDCGTSLPRTITLQAKPAVPSIIFGETVPCATSVETYSIVPVPGATNYNWIVSGGSTIQSGQGTTSITVLVGTSAAIVKVRAENACAVSGYKSLNVSPVLCSFKSLNDGSNSDELLIYPNPTSDMSRVVFASEIAEAGSLKLLDMTGKVVFEKQVNLVIGDNTIELDLTDVSVGVYFVQVNSSVLHTTARLVKE